jgi:hypothetical protein
LKNGEFFSKAYLPIYFLKTRFYFILTYSTLHEYELVKKLGFYDNFKGLKSTARVPRHKLFAQNKLSVPTVVALCGFDENNSSLPPVWIKLSDFFYTFRPKKDTKDGFKEKCLR